VELRAVPRRNRFFQGHQSLIALGAFPSADGEAIYNEGTLMKVVQEQDDLLCWARAAASNRKQGGVHRGSVRRQNQGRRSAPPPPI